MRNYVRVDLGRIAANYRAIQAACPERSEVLAVVKDDAYGHGAIPVAHALAAQGCRRFAVASLEEAAALREAGICVEIVALGGFFAGQEREAAELEITPAIHTAEALERWSKQGVELGRKLPCHLKFDTGMTRLGLPADAAATLELLAQNTGLEVRGIATHLASSEDFHGAHSSEQLQRFFDLRDSLAASGLQPPFVHYGNSAAVAYGDLSQGNLVRCGLALYGYVNPAPGGEPSRLDLQPALEWRCNILAVREVPAGARLGYGGGFVAPTTMRIAALSVGYGDGYSRALSDKGMVVVQGRKRPVVGKVSMDITLIDATSNPAVSSADEAILIGDGVTAAELALLCDTIPYEILSRISPRAERRYA
ncbi:MAG: alanine racemase [Acidobacteria bacterium]|nr:alanine racemase [Acidobacteriota bacterium]